MIQAGSRVVTVESVRLDSGRTIPAGYRGTVMRSIPGCTRPTFLVDFGFRYGPRFVTEGRLELLEANR